jgi:3-keto-5-aminohexanoate cleavage enzyme
MEKLIITLAPTGNVPTKKLNPNTPITIDEIVTDVKKCQKLGVSLVHLHVRDENGDPTCDREIYIKLLEQIKEENINVITQVSTGARGGQSNAEWRGQMLDLDTEMASLSTGSSNFATSINSNPPKLIEELANKMKLNKIKPEIEVFDSAMIANAIRLEKKGILEGPLHFDLVMNVPGSLPGTLKNLLFLIESLPPKSTFTVSGIGSSQIDMLTTSILMGGHVRTGMEDVIKMKDGSMASNYLLVEQVVKIANALGREIATKEEAEKILGLS